MSDANIRVEFGLDEEAEVEDAEVVEEPEVDEVEEEPEPDEPEQDEVEDDSDDDEPEASPEPPKIDKFGDSDNHKQAAKDKGWMTYEEHVKAGKDPAQWKTARHFVEYGELVDKIRSTEKSITSRVDNVKRLYEGRLNDLQEKRQDLERQRKEAIQDGDIDAVTQIDRKMQQNGTETWSIAEQLNSEQQQAIQQEQQVLDKWNEQNPWVFEATDPQSPNHQKALYAMQRYQQLEAAGNIPIEQRLQTLEQEINQHFGGPKTNPNRDKPPVTDKKSASRSAGQVNSFADLPADAKQEWEKYGRDMFIGKDGKPDKKAFVQAFRDSQKDKRG